MGTYRLGIELLSDDMQSEQQLDSVELSSDPSCMSDEMYHISLGES